ncbi:MAG: DinB family protein [Rhodospirillales bacterium]
MDHLLALDEAFDKKSWHGTNLRGSIRGLTAEQAAWRPCRGAHSIQEVVLHASYWKYVVRRRLTGAKRGSFPERGSDWFARPDQPDREAWERDVALLVSQHKLLRETVAGLTPSDLRDPKKLRLIRGVAAHDLYHAGQIQLLKRLSRLV